MLLNSGASRCLGSCPLTEHPFFCSRVALCFQGCGGILQRNTCAHHTSHFIHSPSCSRHYIQLIGYMFSSILSPDALSLLTSRCAQSEIVRSFCILADTSSSCLSQRLTKLREAVQAIDDRVDNEIPAPAGKKPGWSVSDAEWNRRQWDDQLGDPIDCLLKGREPRPSFMETRVADVRDALLEGSRLELEHTNDIGGLGSMMSE